MIERYEEYLKKTEEHIKKQGPGYVTTLPKEQIAVAWMLNDIATEVNEQSKKIDFIMSHEFQEDDIATEPQYYTLKDLWDEKD